MSCNTCRPWINNIISVIVNGSSKFVLITLRDKVETKSADPHNPFWLPVTFYSRINVLLQTSISGLSSAVSDIGVTSTGEYDQWGLVKFCLPVFCRSPEHCESWKSQEKSINGGRATSPLPFRRDNNIQYCTSRIVYYILFFSLLYYVCFVVPD